MTAANWINLSLALAALAGVLITVLKLAGERRHMDADTRLKEMQARAEEIGLLEPLRDELTAVRADLKQARDEMKIRESEFDQKLIQMRAEQAEREAIWEKKCSDLLNALAAANRRTDRLQSRVRDLEQKIREMGGDPADVNGGSGNG